jgi:predicted metal-dependent TIM-barrel fold hydrolase
MAGNEKVVGIGEIGLITSETYHRGMFRKSGL